jgi:hypothetical protein
MKLVKIVKSPKKEKKLMAVFDLGKGKTKTVHFGAKTYGDYTLYHKKDPELAREKRKQYIARHSATENWRSPATPGALSRYVLWEKPTIRSAISAYKKRFRL